MFGKDYELRYSDMDFNGTIKKSAIIDILQDISIIHANSVGLDSEKFKSISVACLLSGWRIRFLKSFIPYETVTVKTGIMKITKCETYRKYEIWQNGECKVIATGLWFTVNTETMRILRIAEELFSAFECVSEEDNNLPCDRLRPGTDLRLFGETVVEKRDLDTNRHMNNVKSVEVILDHIPCDVEIRELQVKYRKEIKEGEKIKIYSFKDEGGLHYEIHNENDEVCVLVFAI